MRSQDIAIIGILLACAAIARLTANFIPGPIVSNLAIGFYCLAIILTMPKIGEALGIGIVAGIICAGISHSIFPAANLISEPVGVLVCLGVYGLLSSRMKRIELSAGITTFLATCASGYTFVLVAFLATTPVIAGEASLLELAPPFFIMLSPIVLGTALANSVVVGLLVHPAIRVIKRSSEHS